MTTTKLGLRAQLFQVGAAVVKKATTRPLPKLRSTTSGAPLRSRATTRTVESAAGRQPFRHGEIPLHRHGLQERVPLGGEDAEDEVPVDLHVGGRLEAIDQQFGLSAQSGTGNSPVPSRYRTSLKYFASERSPRKNATPPPPATYFSKAATAEASSRSMFARLMAGNRPAA